MNSSFVDHKENLNADCKTTLNQFAGNCINLATSTFLNIYLTNTIVSHDNITVMIVVKYAKNFVEDSIIKLLHLGPFNTPLTFMEDSNPSSILNGGGGLT